VEAAQFVHRTLSCCTCTLQRSVS